MEDQKVVILGNGQLARALMARRPTRNTILVSRLFKDVSDYGGMLKLMKSLRPDFIINCAAYNSVGGAETEDGKKESMVVNYGAVNSLCEVSEELGCKLVHICTNYVFDGISETPYSETDKPNPQGHYARTKLMGSQAVLDSGNLVLRTAGVWSRLQFNGNFAAWVGLQLRGDRSFIVDNSQMMSFCYVETLVDCIQQCLLNYQGSQGNKWPTGLYNVADLGEGTWYDFAVKVAEVTGRDKNKIIAGRRNDDVPRPAYAVLDMSKTLRDFGDVLGTWQSRLERHNNLTFYTDG